MAHKQPSDWAMDPAPRAVAEDAIVESLQDDGLAIGGVAQVDPVLRHEMIATAAYFIAEQRGFAPGHEQEDWRRAEAAIDKQLERLLAEG